MSERTPEQQAKDDLLIMHLREAIVLGYSMATPGSRDAVREAFPELFRLPGNIDAIPVSDDLELDDHPMVSWGDNGCFVQTWSWVEVYDGSDDDE